MSVLSCYLLLLWWTSHSKGEADIIIRDYLHVISTGRYFTNPYLSKDEGAFSCFRKDPNISDRILSNSESDFVNFREMLPKLQNKTLMFWGDSLMENQFISFASLLWECDNTCVDISGKGIMAIRSRKHAIDAYLVFSWTLLSIQPHELGSFDTTNHSLSVPFERFINGTIGLRKRYRIPDTVILSTGHHWMMDRYILHGKAAVDLSLFRKALRVINDLVSATIFNTNIRIIWRAVPPRHYENGDWNTGGACHRTEPLTYDEVRSRISRPSEYFIKLAVDLSTCIWEAANASAFEYMDILPTTIRRADGVVSELYVRARTRNVTDCVHYCIPGVPDTWNSLLLKMF